MPRLSLLALLLAPLALHAQPAVTAWGPPDDALDWSETQCLARLATVVCRYPSDPGPGFTFEIESSGRPIADWPSSGWPHTGFRVFSLDRDEEGASPEHVVVANNDGVSNGMAVAYWTLYVLAETPDGPVLRASVPVQEFGPDGQSFAVADGDLVLWATEWLRGPDPSGQRGEGLYFVGRPFRLADGALRPAPDLPIRARRFLDSFARERGEDEAAPVAWLSHPDAETRAADPYLIGGELDGVAGTIRAVEAQEAAYERTNWVLEVAFDGGGTERYTYAPGYAADIDRPFTSFGHEASGRLYPPGLLASDPAAWLEGRRVRVATYAADEPRVVLWLE